MSFQQGLSGLNAASKNLETIGNNVANANTAGFKGAQAQFADVYANAITGGGSGQIGIGTKLANVAQQFTQGNVSASNNPLDIAINGDGFFRVATNGAITYSRNGQFQLDKNGYIVNANGARLTGYMANSSGQIANGNEVDLQINNGTLPPNTTSEVKGIFNLDSSKPVITGTFDPQDATTYNNATSVTVYDSLGDSHIVNAYFVKTAPNVWDVQVSDDTVTPPVGTNIGTMNFNPDGTLSAVTFATPAFTVTPTNGASPLPVNIDLTGTTQYGAAFDVRTLDQDGYSSGALSGFNIGSDGVITGRYTNGKSATLGQVVLASFTNPNGLQPLGNNMWAETSTSGVARVAAPGSGNKGVLQASAVEDSNVDLTAELVNMITAQRVYQANAQTIKTQDQVLQTLVNLR
ncbi:flagellar hook protein FlgE [Noviherbaspirillum sp. Root189]|uniref:flagellar hook protein FlgE n=1 Tax=Noviherbaspirillum sp. Root189 TaxID=1736487 RepID=UPI00070A0C1C|nr:flagellar hook protein FlgE [Noviherbaspirillum sp. Root189]KRB93339.1 flagellar biosynthesis protein FlgE [Noviherbaspirillum sp. Root189]